MVESCIVANFAPSCIPLDSHTHTHCREVTWQNYWTGKNSVNPGGGGGDWRQQRTVHVPVFFLFFYKNFIVISSTLLYFQFSSSLFLCLFLLFASSFFFSFLLVCEFLVRQLIARLPERVRRPWLWHNDSPPPPTLHRRAHTDPSPTRTH